jgi:hypothetical protein
VAGDVERRAKPDRPRLLAARSEVGYVNEPRLAMRDEPESVTADEQEHLTDRARARERDERIRAWGRAHDAIDGAIGVFLASCSVPRGALGTVRAIQRCADRLDRDVAG